jgi:DNA-binding CsgD family transcriptional regulator
MERIPRRDALPENQDFPDNGCPEARAVGVRCIRSRSCPLPLCVLDLPKGQLTLRQDLLQSKILSDRARGRSVANIALRRQVSERTVWRYLRRLRQQATDRSYDVAA